MVIVGIADVIEGVGGVDGLVRQGRSHLFVQRRRPIMPPGVLTDKKKSAKRNSIFFTCFYYLAPHFKNDDSSLTLGCRARKVFVEKLTNSKIKENFPVFVRGKEKKG